MILAATGSRGPKFAARDFLGRSYSVAVALRPPRFVHVPTRLSPEGMLDSGHFIESGTNMADSSIESQIVVRLAMSRKSLAEKAFARDVRSARRSDRAWFALKHFLHRLRKIIIGRRSNYFP